LIFLLN